MPYVFVEVKKTDISKLLQFTLVKSQKILYNIKVISRCDGMADVTDSKSVGGNTVWVQVPPPAPLKECILQYVLLYLLCGT